MKRHLDLILIEQTDQKGETLDIVQCRIVVQELDNVRIKFELFFSCPNANENLDVMEIIYTCELPDSVVCQCFTICGTKGSKVTTTTKVSHPFPIHSCFSTQINLL